MEHEYEDLMWVEDAIFMERNSRTFQKRIAQIDENTEALCEFLKAHPKGMTKKKYHLFCVSNFFGFICFSVQPTMTRSDI